MNVLLVGGAGFIGLHLAQQLIENHGANVTVLDDFSRGHDRDSVLHLVGPQLRYLDLTLSDYLALNHSEEYDYIYHLAAIVGVSNVIEKPTETLVGNIMLVKQVVELASRSPNLKNLVFFSTSEVYAGKLKTGGIDFPTLESTDLVVPQDYHPRDSYFLSKIIGEALLTYSDLPIVILRPHNFYGPRMGFSHVIPELMVKFRMAGDNPVVVANSQHTRCFYYISDAIKDVIGVALSCNDGSIFNVGQNTEELSMFSLSELIADLTGFKGEIIEASDSVASPPRRVPDVSKIRSLLPRDDRVPIEEGLVQCWQWYSER